jgi:tRNA(fMet)-specific endonuclease VapC
MGYLLDSNVWIAILRGRVPSLTLRIQQTIPSEIHICSVVKAELIHGALKSSDPKRNLGLLNTLMAVYSSPPFDDKAAEKYAEIRTDLESKGTPIGANDYLIAAIALANGMVLVTHNTGEFSRVAGLQLEDWQLP